jgi:hypothetical protein
MNLNYDWLPLIGELRSIGMEFHAGLSDVEVAGIEGTYGFRFPPDLRAFLQTAMPLGEHSYFPDWRSNNEGVLRDWLDIPRQGIFFDIECNGFWLPEWGERPESLEDALQIAGKLLDNAPKLIPICQHRMIPDDPHLEGNPVFSVHQTDIIYYGHDLEDYLRHEFGLSGRKPWPEELRPIRFWDIERFQEACWGDGIGPRFFDNRRGILP